MAVAGTGRTPAVAAALPRRQPGRVLLPEASCRQPRRRCACDRAAAEARARAVPVRRLDRGRDRPGADEHARSEEHTSELQSLMRISYAVFCLKKKKNKKNNNINITIIKKMSYQKKT